MHQDLPLQQALQRRYDVALNYFTKCTTNKKQYNDYLGMLLKQSEGNGLKINATTAPCWPQV